MAYILRSPACVFSLRHTLKVNIQEAALLLPACDMLPSDSLGFNALIFTFSVPDSSPTSEVNAFVLSTLALVSLNALA